ncbi:MAG: PBSX family phage terminase large subunit [Bacteroidales bacterium]|nr:PBSX family phage terminase large subunit [Bacteroidales bacterium]
MSSDQEEIEVNSTCVYSTIQYALENGYTTISEQGGSRSGKTYNTLQYLIDYAMTNNNICISIVRATLPALKGSVLVDFKEIMLKRKWYDENRMNKTELTYTFQSGSIIEFFSCDSEQKLRGRKRDVLFCNEANELSYEMWQQLKMRTKRFSILDYNPSFSDEHWICQVNKEEKIYHFVTTYEDNIENLPQTIIDEIESLQWKNPSLYRIYKEGEQAIVEGLVFPTFTEINEIPINVDRRYIGVDYGYTNDPTAIVEVAIEGDNLYINEIAYATHMMSNEIISILKKQNLKVISESADPRMVDEIRMSGVNIQAVHKYKGSIEAGLQKMQSMKINITKNSTNVIKEFKNYTYQKNKDGKWLNEPIDTYNHAIDAVRYVIIETSMRQQGRTRFHFV